MTRIALALAALSLIGCVDRLQQLEELGQGLEDTWSSDPTLADAPAQASGPAPASWGGGAFPYTDEVRWTAPTTGLMWGDVPGVGDLDPEVVSADVSVGYDYEEDAVVLDVRFRYANDESDEVILMATHVMWDTLLEPGQVVRMSPRDVALVIDEDQALSEEWQPESALLEVEERVPGVLQLTLFTDFRRFDQIIATTEVVPESI